MLANPSRETLRTIAAKLTHGLQSGTDPISVVSEDESHVRAAPRLFRRHQPDESTGGLRRVGW